MALFNWLGSPHGVNMCCTVQKDTKSAFLLINYYWCAVWMPVQHSEYDLVNMCLMAVSYDTVHTLVTIFSEYIAACPSLSNA